MTTLFQHHLPSEVRIIRYPGQPTYTSPEVFVYDMVSSDDIPVYCRSYLFLKRWLQVFMTMDMELNLKADVDAVFPFVFNCDITTPHYIQGDSIFTTDLCLDVLVGADGLAYQIKDTNAFETMYASRLFGKLWYEKAHQEVAFLSELLDKGQFLDFLNAVSAFPTIPTRDRMVAMERCAIENVAFEYHPRFPRYSL